jgi:hypothetical protein
MKRFLLFIILSSITVFAFGQTVSLSGRITDQKNQPVAGADILLVELKQSVLTDNNGIYKFEGIKNGTYTLNVSSMLTHTKTLSVRVNGANTEADVQVNGDKNEMLNQVDIHTKTEKREIETSGYAVTVIDTKDAAVRN